MARYTLRVFGSRVGGGTRTSRYTVAGAEPAYLDVMENADHVVTFGPVVPAGRPQAYVYLGALEISGRATR